MEASATEARELTRQERRAIRKLVIGMCANYDCDYGCLPLDYGGCYMLDKWWTGCYCRYFQKAVLPLDPVLQTVLFRCGPARETRRCVVCGASFPQEGKRACCSKACAGALRRKRQRDYMRQKRGRP